MFDTNQEVEMNEVDTPDNTMQLSDEEFLASFDLSMPTTEEADESVLEAQEEESEEVDNDEYIDVEEEELDDTDEPEEDPNQDEDDFDYGEVDFESEFKKIVGSKIKANGREVQIKSTDEAIRLMQMGMGYHKHMSEFKPVKQVLPLLQEHGLLDSDKLSFAIDLLNKDPKAINKLVNDVDLAEVLDETNSGYEPKHKPASEEQVKVSEVLSEIKETESYTKTMDVITKQLDEPSRDILVQYPEVIKALNNQMADGTYDKVMAEVERRTLFGQLPEGMPLLMAYKQVGDEMFLNQDNKATMKPEIKKPVTHNKLAAKAPRRTSAKPRSPLASKDIAKMSDEEFLKAFNM